MTYERHLLAAFDAVAAHGTVGRAAIALNATQPTISRNIRTLEDQIGQTLFERDSHGMHLTPVGEAFLPRARLILYEMNAAQELVDAYGGLRRGYVRVGGVTAIALSVLPDVLARIMTVAPDLQIEVTVASEDQLERALANREIDIMFATDPPREIEAVLLSTRSFGDRCVAFCASTHPRLGDDAPLYALLAEGWTLPPPEAPPRRQLERILQDGGHPLPRVTLQTDSVELMIATVCRSEVVGWLPEPLLAAALERGAVRILGLGKLELVRRFHVYRRARGTFPQAGQVFVDALAFVGSDGSVRTNKRTTMG
jgi:DNA-binding transcriptional LysR family regulator